MEIEDKEEQFEKSTIKLPKNKHFFVVVGGNNSGKSTFLRSVIKTYGKNSYMVDVNRTLLKGEGAQNKGYLDNLGSYLDRARNVADDNSEKPIQILQDLFNLNNSERREVIDWYNKYFPNNIYEEQENLKNDASPLLLKINGFSITKQGSGIRATLEIFIKLFDPNIKILCIDEPELGLEPYLQKYLYQALKDKAGKDKKVIIATHSQHFLDHTKPRNNYICERNQNGKLKLSKVNDYKELKDIIFRLLGNTLSSFMLPEKILLLEGLSDITFISKALKLLSKDNYAIHGSGGNGNIKYAINSITQFLQFNKTFLSVYKENVWVVVDKPTRNVITRKWENLLGDKSRIEILSKNGIEYYYPKRIMQSIFKSNKSVNIIVKSYLRENPNKFNNIRLTKIELATKVALNLTKKDLSDNNNELFNFLRNLP